MTSHHTLDRRDRRSRADRDAVAQWLALHPRMLGRLPGEVVEAMREQLFSSTDRLAQVALLRAQELGDRAEGLEHTMRQLGDAEGGALAMAARTAAERLAAHLASPELARRRS